MSVICDECDLHICITNPELNLCHPDMTIRDKLKFLDDNRGLTREQIVEKTVMEDLQREQNW